MKLFYTLILIFTTSTLLADADNHKLSISNHHFIAKDLSDKSITINNNSTVNQTVFVNSIKFVVDTNSSLRVPCYFKQIVSVHYNDEFIITECGNQGEIK